METHAESLCQVTAWCEMHPELRDANERVKHAHQSYWPYLRSKLRLLRAHKPFWPLFKLIDAMVLLLRLDRLPHATHSEVKYYRGTERRHEDAWVLFQSFFDTYHDKYPELLPRVNPAVTLGVADAQALHKLVRDPEMDPQVLHNICPLASVLGRWVRGAWLQWCWAVNAPRRVWARVILAGHSGHRLSPTQEADPQSRALANWFLKYPGMCRVAGGMMLRYWNPLDR